MITFVSPTSRQLYSIRFHYPKPLAKDSRTVVCRIENGSLIPSLRGGYCPFESTLTQTLPFTKEALRKRALALALKDFDRSARGVAWLAYHNRKGLV